jgi:hypothetical protein
MKDRTSYRCNFLRFGNFVWCVALLLITQSAWCLPDFTLSVIKTNETCTGNGSLAFLVTGTDPDAVITYNIYHLPDAAAPIATLSGNTLTGLSSGNYRVLATQSLGSETNTRQQDVTIENLIDTLQFNLSASGNCSGGIITVTVVDGTAVSYEILSGPVTLPPQSAAIFTALPSGTYQVRVFDACGEGLVKPITLPNTIPGMNINAVTFPSAELPDCTSITVANGLVAPAGVVIVYPLNLTYTIHPPVGADIVLAQTIASGVPIRAIPFFPGQAYSYDLQIVDACGNTYTKNNNAVNKNLNILLSKPQMGCGFGLNISAVNYKSPFTVSFVNAPPGFDPAVFNAQHPGPYFNFATYYSATVPLPAGTYQVQIVDACGWTAIASTELSQTAPSNPLQSTIYKGCDNDHGSVRIYSTTSNLASVTITSAPTSYNGTLPHNVSFNIRNNTPYFLMNTLPVGLYVFHIIDVCGREADMTIDIQPILPPTTTVQITPNCASFDLSLLHTSNLTQQQELFWLQKYNPITGLWGHPETGNSTDSNTFPGVLNSYPLENGQINPDIPFSGTFRVLKSFPVFTNGSDYNNGQTNDITCAVELYNFEFDNVPAILAIYSFSCGANTSDVLVQATGMAPIIYRITLKNGLPFEIDNANTAVFTGLAPAIYNFQIQDNCGNIANRVFDVNEPAAFAITPSTICSGQSASLTLPLLPFLNYQWWKDDNTANILSTTNTLVFPAFNSTTDSGNYHVQISYPNVNSCVNQVLHYTISPLLENPHAGEGNFVTYCGSQATSIFFRYCQGYMIVLEPGRM